MSETTTVEYFQGFKTTKKGRALIAKLLAEETLQLSKVVAGSGRCPSLDEADVLEDLIAPEMEGTSTTPQYDVDVVTLQLEFRSDMNGGVEKGFFLYEVGVFAIDPEEGEILLYYGSLGDLPNYISAYSTGRESTFRYPISITVGEDKGGAVTGYPANAFVTHEDLQDHINDPDAHANLRGRTHVSATMPDDFTVGDTWWKIPQLEPEYPDEDVIPDPEPDVPDVAPELETNDVFKGGDAYDLRPTDELQELNMTVDGIDKGVPFVEKITDSIYKLT